MDIELKESGIRMDNPQSKTERVMNKWSGSDGEIQRDSIRKAASQYAKLEVNNRILKYIIATVVVFLFVLLGFMIASVVIGVNITKEVSVKNGQLVAASGNNTVVKTSTVKYHNKINLNSPSSVVDSLTTVSVNVADGMYQGVLQFDVVSYVFIPGKQLTFYGHTHQADVNPDGTVTVNALVPFSSRRSTTSSTTTGNSLDGSSLTNGSGTSVVSISTCEQLSNINAATSYKLTNSLTCSGISLPLLSGQTYTGNFDGNQQRLTITASNNGPVALFDTISGSVFDLDVAATFSGVGKCATFALNAVQGSYFNRLSSHSTINCASSVGTNVAGGFFATVSSNSGSNNVQILNSVSQVAITFNDANSVSGGFFGTSDSASSIVTLTNNAAGSSFTTTGSSDAFGFLSGSTSDCQHDSNYCLVEVGQTGTDLPCCRPIEICPNNPSKQNCDSTFCYKCRDYSHRGPSSTRNLSLKRAASSVEVNPVFVSEQPQCY